MGEGERPSPLPQAGGAGGGPVRKFRSRETLKAQRLRREATPPERRLWQAISKRQLEGWKFSHQMPIGPYVADFLCREAKLVVELDGISHDVRQDEDRRRDGYMRAQGYQTLRFANADVMSNLEGVLMTILAALNSYPPPGPSRRREGRSMTETTPHDVIIVGSGAAGLTAAIALADHCRVLVLAKGELTGGSTAWAQGGIAAVLDAGDTFENHIDDTMVAGAGLNRRETVEFVVENAPHAIERLIEMGVSFNKEEGALHLTREGGHSHRRIVHVDDATGWAVQAALLKTAQAHPNITLLPGQACIDLITGRHEERYSGSGRVWGVYALDEATGEVHAHVGRATILASGGAGRVYQFSTAPRGATGDGIAMAWRAGCRVSNMEMMQFHPTCLYNLEVKNFLITEAVRGEGGILKHPVTGHRYMPDYDPRAELAPRDIVARANDDQIKRFGLDYVHLDISDKDPDFVAGHFPNIYEKLLTLGIDMTKQPIPVVPAQHYTCGGVLIDLDGRTDLPGLYAAGEVTESGLHGANRLASNSLLECFVFGEAAAKHIARHWDELGAPPAIRPWDESRVTDSDEEVVIKQNWTEIRRFMWNYVGIVRTTKRLERAQHRINMLSGEVGEYYGHFRVTTDLIELRNLLQCAELIVKSALHRKESRGLHYTLDYPELAAEAVDTVLVP